MAQPYAKVRQPQAYQIYYSEPRPGDKLPPLDYFKGGHVHLVPGERYCRWRHPVTGILCENADRYDSLELRDHYRVDHGCKVAPNDIPLFEGLDSKRRQQSTQWYSDMLQGRMPSWPPASQQDCQTSSSGSTRPKAEHDMQDSGEIQVQQKDESREEKQPLYLKIENLQLGPQEESDRHSAVRLCTLFNQYQSSMPPRVRSRLLHLLTSGQFQHNAQSIFQPLKHQLSIHMYDEDVGEANWISVTYERWFILVGIYGWEMLREHADGIRKSVVMRYGEPIDGDLTFKNSSDNSGSIVRPFLSQLGDEVFIWGPMIRQNEQLIQQHEQTLLTQSSMIQKLQAMIEAQQKQIDRLNAIIGVQPCREPGKHMDDGDNDVGMGHEISQAYEEDTGSSHSTPDQLTEITTSRKRVRRG